jgi:hypothetical protein
MQRYGRHHPECAPGLPYGFMPMDRTPIGIARYKAFFADRNQAHIGVQALHLA